MKKRLIVSLIMIVLLLVLSIDHGWRLFGFDGCSSPNVLSVTDVKVTDDRVKVQAITYHSAFYYAGYMTEIKDKNLYIGMRYQLVTVFGGFFDINIPLNDVDIEKIYIKGKGSSKLIWEKNNKKVN